MAEFVDASGDLDETLQNGAQGAIKAKHGGTHGLE
jgi:hypothetical protein